MAKTEMLQTQIDSKLKADAEAVLDQLGLSPSEAIRLFYTQVALRKGLPFDLALPNAATRRAMRDVVRGHGLTTYKDTQEMFDKLEC